MLFIIPNCTEECKKKTETTSHSIKKDVEKKTERKCKKGEKKSPILLSFSQESPYSSRFSLPAI
jgi:hypothetical protein